jgi:hypothetical protein
MSSIINTDTFAVNFLPPKKRLPIYKAWTKTLLNPLQVLYNTMFGTFKDGNAAALYNGATAYAVGNQVKYTDKAVYQCWVASTGNLPTNTNYWFKIQDNFVGIEPRCKYNAQHILFEWALNEWFGTTFVNVPGASDIYIDPNNASDAVLYVGFTETNSSLIVYGNGEAQTFIQAINIANTGDEFTINVPIGVANALTIPPATDIAPNISANNENIIRQIADLYNYAGITYDVITY